MYNIRQYLSLHTTWPYRPADFERYDPSSDSQFYVHPRLVTHIDDHAIAALQTYYSTALPKQGRILDFCSSWISHFPPELADRATEEDGLEVIGLGMNQHELDCNPILRQRIIRDLNVEPSIPEGPPLDAATCVVSIDYLTRPRDVLTSLRERMKPGGQVHLAVSNRCFPTKAIRRWLEISEQSRLDMVGDYLYFAGWKKVEIVELSDGTAELTLAEARAIGRNESERYRVDPLWVVRAEA
jgi:hypothetical protein